MSWTGSALGTIAGVTGVIAGLTGPVADASQISSAQTMLLAEVAGICTTTYNGAKLTVSGDAQTTIRTFQFTLIPLDLDT